MSDVKRKVINIVLGKGSEPIPETVTITENQFVATVPESHTKESAIALLVKAGIATEDGQLHENYTHDEPSRCSPGVYEEEPKVLSVNEVRGAEMLEWPDDPDYIPMNILPWTPEELDAMDYSTEPVFIGLDMSSKIEFKKPKIKFRTYGAGGKYLLPQLSESSPVSYAFTDAHRMPQIVL